MAASTDRPSLVITRPVAVVAILAALGIGSLGTALTGAFWSSRERVGAIQGQPSTRSKPDAESPEKPTPTTAVLSSFNSTEGAAQGESVPVDSPGDRSSAQNQSAPGTPEDHAAKLFAKEGLIKAMGQRARFSDCSTASRSSSGRSVSRMCPKT